MIFSENLVSLWNTENIECIGKHRSIGKKWFKCFIHYLSAAWRNRKNLVSSSSSVSFLIAVCSKLCFTKLLIIIFIVFFNAFLSFHLKIIVAMFQ